MIDIDMTAEPVFNETTVRAKENTLLSPRFYTTDFATLDRLDVTPVRAEWDALIAELERDENQDHFQRTDTFRADIESLPPALRAEFLDFLTSSVKVALWTYVTLALMRWSAKLNLFLGVPVFHREWLPAHLHHVATYVRRRAMNPLFPFSITAATAAGVWMLVGMPGDAAGSFVLANHVLVATLIALGLLEHWCLVVPLGEARLWKWALGTRDEAPRLAPWPQASRLSGARHPLPPG